MKKLILLLPLILIFCGKDQSVEPVSSYTVTFRVDGSQFSEQKVDENKQATAPSTPTKVGYDFISWQVGGEDFEFKSSITADVILEAKFKIKVLEINFYETLGKDIIKTINVEYGNPVLETNIADPIRDGYNFLGWRYNGTSFDFSTVFEENASIVASWVRVYKVSFNTSTTTSIPDLLIEDGSSIPSNKIPQDPERLGYIFQYWLKDNVQYDFDLKVSDDVILQASWKPIDTSKKTYELTLDFNDEGTTEPKIISYQEGDIIVKPTDPTRADYRFKEWQDQSGNAYVFGQEINSNISLSALWEMLTPRPPITPNTSRVVMAYFPSYSENFPSPNSKFREIPSFVNHLVVAFAKPNMKYEKGSDDISDVGLEFSSYGSGADLACKLKQGINILKERGIKVVLSMGGETYWNNPNALDINYQQIKDFVDDFGLDGIDWDFEPNGSFRDIGSATNVKQYIAMIRKSREIMPKGQYIIACAPAGVGALGGPLNDDPDSPFAYANRNKLTGESDANLSSDTTPQVGISLFGFGATGHMIPVIEAVGSDIDLIAFQGYNTGAATNRALLYDAYAYYADKYGFEVALGAHVPPEPYGPHFEYTPQVMGDISEYIAGGGKDGLRSDSKDGIMLWQLLLKDGNNSGYGYLNIASKIFAGTNKAEAIRDAEKYTLQPIKVLPPSCSPSGSGGNSKTYCGKPEWNASSVYSSPNTEVYYKAAIWKNKWYADAGAEPSKEPMWERVSDCDDTIVTLTTPVDSAKDITLTPEFSWTPPSSIATESLTYKLYLGTNSQPTTELASDLSTTNYKINASNSLAYDSTYYWKVTTTNSGITYESVVQSFSTIEDPNKPPIINLIKPTSGQRIAGATNTNSFDIEVEVTDAETSVSSVIATVEGTPISLSKNGDKYTATYNANTYGSFKIEIKAKDDTNKEAAVSRLVWIYDANNTPTYTPVPSRVLVGYWHNFRNGAADGLKLSEIPPEYNVVNVSFIETEKGKPYKATFDLDRSIYATEQAFIDDIKLLKSQGRKVLISIGGQNGHIELRNESEKNQYVDFITQIVTKYGFDGIDIDYEGGSLRNIGDTSPISLEFSELNNPELKYGITAIREIYNNFGSGFMVTAAPETFYVQAAQGIYPSAGQFLPFIHNLRDILTFLQVQLYNTGLVTGIDGKGYAQGTPDFIVAMSEMLITGFNLTSSIDFLGLREDQVVIGLPASEGAAGGGYATPENVKKAMLYLLDGKTDPNITYLLQKTSGYPNIRGMMTWSVNWDEVVDNSFSKNYKVIFDGR